MKKLNSLDNFILKILYESSGSLDEFTAFRRSKVSFSEFTKSLTKLYSNQYLIEVNKKIQLSDKARIHILSSGNELGSKDKDWREVPEELKLAKHSKFDLYIPSQKKLDKRTFKKSDDRVE